jgi:hypothetical protein
MSELSQEQESLPAVRLVRAIGRKDWPAAEALIPDDFYYETVLSDEEIFGKAAYMEFNQTFPGDWSMPIDQVVHEGTSTVIRLRFIVGDVVDHAIMFFESENGIVIRQSDWWPEFYDPPAWRAGKYPRRKR